MKLVLRGPSRITAPLPHNIQESYYHYPLHQGIILAVQKSWAASDLIKALTRLLTETQAADRLGQVRWLNE